MNGIAEELTEHERAAQAYLVEHGWSQGDFKSPDGTVCLHGAVMYCRPIGVLHTADADD